VASVAVSAASSPFDPYKDRLGFSPRTGIGMFDYNNIQKDKNDKIISSVDITLQRSNEQINLHREKMKGCALQLGNYATYQLLGHNFLTDQETAKYGIDLNPSERFTLTYAECVNDETPEAIDPVMIVYMIKRMTLNEIYPIEQDLITARNAYVTKAKSQGKKVQDEENELLEAVRRDAITIKLLKLSLNGNQAAAQRLWTEGMIPQDWYTTSWDSYNNLNLASLVLIAAYDSKPFGYLLVRAHLLGHYEDSTPNLMKRLQETSQLPKFSKISALNDYIQLIMIRDILKVEDIAEKEPAINKWNVLLNAPRLLPLTEHVIYTFLNNNVNGAPLPIGFEDALRKSVCESAPLAEGKEVMNFTDLLKRAAEHYESPRLAEMWALRVWMECAPYHPYGPLQSSNMNEEVHKRRMTLEEVITDPEAKPALIQGVGTILTQALQLSFANLSLGYSLGQPEERFKILKNLSNRGVPSASDMFTNLLLSTDRSTPDAFNMYMPDFEDTNWKLAQLVSLSLHPTGGLMRNNIKNTKDYKKY
jgi:hypothetical protein